MGKQDHGMSRIYNKRLNDSSYISLFRKTSVSAVSTTSNIAVSDGFRYRVVYNMKWGATPGVLNLQFNADGTTVYGWSGSVYDATSGSTNQNGGGNVAQIAISGSDSVPNGGYTNGVFEFMALTDDSTDVFVISENVLGNNSTYLFTSHYIYGQYNGGSAISSFRLLASSGDMTGNILVYKYPTS